MPLPQIDVNDVLSVLPDATDVTYMTQGGQKVVFSCFIDGIPYVAKFLLISSTQDITDPQNLEATMPEIDAVTSRARREVDTMSQCDVPTLVKLGPIGLNAAVIKNQTLLYFTEEKIEGDDLKTILDTPTTLSVNDAVKLAIDISEAIDAIWNLQRVHRDIKPGNIMRRADTGRFVLLDVGLVFDLTDISVTASHIIVGTPIYFSPEQMEYARKRQLDFRSDLFSLGTVLYESITGQHPFTINCTSTTEVFANIAYRMPPNPSSLRDGIPDKLDQIIMRLLRKSPHLRYRTCAHLLTQLNSI